MKKHLWLCSLLTVCAVGGELGDILSHYKETMLRYDRERSDVESDKLERSWINPIRLQYTKSYNTQFRNQTIGLGNFSVVIDQPIFRSGGIYNAIKYAKAWRHLQHSQIKLQRNQLIAQAVEILFNLKKNRLMQAKLRHQIANDVIDIRQKKERYEAGVLDSSFLDQAILKKSRDEVSLLELKQAALELRRSFSLLSDKKPESIKLPTLRLIPKKRFESRHLELKRDRQEADTQRYQYRMTVAKYLPALSVQGTYTDGDLNPLWSGIGGALKERYYNYGFRIAMPLDINTMDDIESSKLAKLRAQVKALDTKRVVDEEYRWIGDALRILDRKIALAKKDERIYANLYKVTRNLVKAGEKTRDDAEVMRHSLQIRKLDRQIYAIEKQLWLLKLYAKVEDAF